MLRKYRVELIQLYNQVNMVPGDNTDSYNLKIAELEKKLIEESGEDEDGGRKGASRQQNAGDEDEI